VRPPRSLAAVLADGDVVAAPLATAAVGDDLDRVRDVRELLAQEVDEIPAPRGDDEQQSCSRASHSSGACDLAWMLKAKGRSK
jgi:hypothetical protein